MEYIIGQLEKMAADLKKVHQEMCTAVKKGGREVEETRREMAKAVMRSELEFREVVEGIDALHTHVKDMPDQLLRIAEELRKQGRG